MKIKKCRNCNHKKLIKLFSLGKQKFSGKFPARGEKIPNGELDLIMCSRCKLVQLRNVFNLKYLYNKDYGYRTGINKTMTNHVKSVTTKLAKISKLRIKDNVLDIASNDGTLLNHYKKNIITWGIDPILYKYKKNYNKINYKITNFFNYKFIIRKKKSVKFKIITALSVFYDLENPHDFIVAVKKLLHKDGIFYLEFQDLMKILKNNMFDTICHEHLEYYSVNFINSLMKKHNLRVFDHYYNKINGGSSAYFICHRNSYYKSHTSKINKIINQEIKYGIKKISTYKNFKKKIDLLKNRLNLLINNLVRDGKVIHGYAASTKGNILLQYLNLNNKQIKFISDRNPKKSGLYTPGSKIKIITEKESRKMKPDYYLVLAWHFRREILLREKELRRKGTRFLFPLPTINVV